MVSVLLATPVILYRKVTLGPDNRSLVCFPKYPSEAHRAFHLFFEVVTGFLLPFLAVVASYSDIRRRLRVRRFRRSLCTGRLLAFIILAFAAFWLPYHVVNLAEGVRALAGKTLGSRPESQRLHLTRKRSERWPS